MTPEEIRAYNRAKTQRRRAAESLGLEHVRLWATKGMSQDINRMREATEAMIDEALARKHGCTWTVTFDEELARKKGGK